MSLLAVVVVRYDGNCVVTVFRLFCRLFFLRVMWGLIVSGDGVFATGCVCGVRRGYRELARSIVIVECG